jgi:hypothetical protein
VVEAGWATKAAGGHGGGQFQFELGRVIQVHKFDFLISW